MYWCVCRKVKETGFYRVGIEKCTGQGGGQGAVLLVQLVVKEEVREQLPSRIST